MCRQVCSCTCAFTSTRSCTCRKERPIRPPAGNQEALTTYTRWPTIKDEDATEVRDLHLHVLAILEAEICNCCPSQYLLPPFFCFQTYLVSAHVRCNLVQHVVSCITAPRRLLLHCTHRTHRRIAWTSTWAAWSLRSTQKWRPRTCWYVGRLFSPSLFFSPATRPHQCSLYQLTCTHTQKNKCPLLIWNAIAFGEGRLRSSTSSASLQG